MPNSTDRAFDLPSDLPRNIEASLKKAAEFALSIQEKDGSWISEVELNPGPTAQAVILHHALAIAFPERLLPKALKYTLRTQQPDGGWGNYENAVSDVSVTAECYVQMRLSGLAANAEPCVRARAVIEKLGGAPAMNPWTQLYLGALGVLPWERIQKIPVELSLIPAWTSVAIENFAYWVKVISTPMMLLHAVGPGKPVAEAPLIAQELGISREDRRVLISRGVSAFLKVFEKTKLLPLRKMAINAALKKIDEFTEKNGDFGGNTCTAMNVLLALDRMGKSGEPRFKNGLKAMMNYGFETDDEWHLQTCQSLVWDTAFMLGALPPALPSALSPALSSDDSLNDSLNSSLHGRAASQAAACRWLESRQITEVKGAWSRNVEAAPGGWCFGDGHDHFPVTDCTAVSLLALAKHQPGFKASISAEKGVHWLLAMQHKEGGWSAYERYQGGQWLNKLLSFKDIPNALCDLPKADVSSKVVESLCEFRNDFPEIGPHLLSARSYLLAARTQSNLWRGNYGVNYIYGTAFAARALFAIDQKSDPEWAKPVRDFFLSRQNPDGGWGEEDKSYSEPRLAGKGSSGAVQTAWALMGLCAASDAGEASLKAIGLGCQYLLKQQKENGSWDDPRYLGTVFPEKVYFRYGLYPFYFPMLALEAAQKRLIKSL